MKMEIREIGEKLSQSEKILVGLGEEWQMKPDGGDLRGCRLDDPGQSARREAYASLVRLLAGKDYYIVTTAMDGAVWEAGFEKSRITAPCARKTPTSHCATSTTGRRAIPASSKTPSSRPRKPIRRG